MTETDDDYPLSPQCPKCLGARDHFERLCPVCRIDDEWPEGDALDAYLERYRESEEDRP